MRKRHRIAVVGVLAAVIVGVTAATSFGVGGGAVANFTPATTKIIYSGWTTPANGALSHYSDVGRLPLGVGSYTITAHTVAQLSSLAPAGTVVECYLTAPNANPQYTAVALAPAKGSNIHPLDVETVSNAPNGGTADLFCRVNTRGDSKLATSKATSIIATPVASASWTTNEPPPFGSY